MTNGAWDTKTKSEGHNAIRWHLNHEKVTMTFKKSQRLRMHFKKNHSGHTRQASPKPLPVLPPFQSPSPPPPVPIPGTPENPIDVNKGSRESPIEIWDDPKPVASEESDEKFPFCGWTSPSVVNDWEGRVNWNAARQCGNCGSISHGTRWCQEGLTYNSEMGFWYMDKSREIWPGEGVVLWFPFHQLGSRPSFSFFPYDLLTFSLFYYCFTLIVSLWLMLHLDGCAHQHIAWFSSVTHSL